MGNHNSPLDSLAAFALVFATGVISTISLIKYIDKIKRDARREARAEVQAELATQPQIKEVPVFDEARHHIAQRTSFYAVKRHECRHGLWNGFGIDHCIVNNQCGADYGTITLALNGEGLIHDHTLS
ncbi:hypothetical protein AAKU64_004235 [Undibacterium sp. GrIS 1.8]|uniref:hypothetical protein n=1 Tax=Undibacterium sp. GrIS 1.8 TaxID=3143934 RepID=UPI0033979A00